MPVTWLRTKGNREPPYFRQPVKYSQYAPHRQRLGIDLNLSTATTALAIQCQIGIHCFVPKQGQAPKGLAMLWYAAYCLYRLYNYWQQQQQQQQDHLQTDDILRSPAFCTAMDCPPRWRSTYALPWFTTALFRSLWSVWITVQFTGDGWVPWQGFDMIGSHYVRYAVAPQDDEGMASERRLTETWTLLPSVGSLVGGTCSQQPRL